MLVSKNEAVAARLQALVVALLQQVAQLQARRRATFGAVFAEVRVDTDLGVVRVPHATAAYGIGTVLNAKTARSQMLGGIVWGMAWHGIIRGIGARLPRWPGRQRQLG